MTYIAISPAHYLRLVKAGLPTDPEIQAVWLLNIVEHVKKMETSGTYPEPSPEPSPERPESWEMQASEKGRYNGSSVEVMREGAHSKLLPSVFLCVVEHEDSDDCTAILTPDEADEVAAQIMRFAASARVGAEQEARPVPTDADWWWGAWRHGPHLPIECRQRLGELRGRYSEVGDADVEHEGWTWLADLDDPTKAQRCVPRGGQ